MSLPVHLLGFQDVAAFVAQLVARLIVAQEDEGSKPSGCTFCLFGGKLW